MMLRLILGGLVGALMVTSVEAFPAGERHLTTTESSAAVRDPHHSKLLRITVWYPAIGPEREIDLGPSTDPVFIAGRVAPDATFADSARHPLILLSHGFGGDARQMTWLGAPLARHGYVVVAVDHPGTNGVDGVSAEGAYAPWERAGDLAAALDRALADPALGPHIDAGRIGVAGFSLGGFTALLEAGARTDFPHFLAFCEGAQRDAICNPQLEYPLDFKRQAAVLADPRMHAVRARENEEFGDRRVKAAFLIAPALLQAVNAQSLTLIRIPVDIVLGDADPVAPPKTNGEIAAQLIPGARLKTLPGVGHYDFLSVCGPSGLKLAAALCTDNHGADRAQTHAATVADAIAFFDEVL